MPSTVPFEYLSHFVTLPVVADDTETRFIFDTGIGVTLLSQSLAGRLGVRPDGSEYTGQRMSGQEVRLPLASLRSLSVGSARADDVTVAIFDMDLPGLDGIEGILSLDHFLSTPVTVDYQAGTVIIEDAASLARRVADGVPVNVRVHREGPATEVFLPLDLPSRRPISVEVDMGSDSLILDAALAAELGIDLQAETTTRQDGVDETGNAFSRYFTALTGIINVSGAPAVSQADPAVMFQKIIHDGLVGDAFLRNFTVSYDLANSRMIFATPR